MTLFFTIVMSVTWSLSFRRQESTLKNWSKNVDRLEYLEHTLHLDIDAFQAVVCSLSCSEIDTLKALHPLMANWMPVEIVVVDD